jgi:hypothetical protein
VAVFIFRGKTYHAISTSERGESEEPALRALTRSSARGHVNDGEHFAGDARKLAKTSFAVSAEHSFRSPGAVLDSILKGTEPADNDWEMRAKLNESSPRVPEEQRNVRVTAFLYATKKETDNDFHLLIGDKPDGGDGRFMTAEVSGLPSPDDSSTPRFQRARDQYRSFFEEIHHALPGEGYIRFHEPVPVTVSGSLFFDVDHSIGEVHSGTVRPESVWEIHPVSDLVFGTGGGQ